MLAVCDGVQRDRDVGLWDGEVEDDLDVRVGEQLIYGQHLRDAELLGLRLRLRAVEIGAGDDFENRETGAWLK